MIYLVLVALIVGYSAYVYALKYLPIATVSLYADANPIIAVLLRSRLLDEPFGVRTLAAAAPVPETWRTARLRAQVRGLFASPC